MKRTKLGLLALIASAMLIFTGCGSTGGGTGDTNTTTGGVAVHEPRALAATAGAAEYHTGIGYGQTLFDSADKKCQGCHFELYDTWNSSMHAKSWKDTMFQVKYQDYLRIQLASITEDGNGTSTTMGLNTVTGVAATVASDGNTTSSTGSATTRVVGGSSKVCLKCHAPGAYYAGDFNITIKKVATNIGDIVAGDYATKVSAKESNIYKSTAPSEFNISAPTTIAAVAKNGNLYTATYHIGHEANREGINCATCHSVESIRLMGAAGTEGVRDDGTYKLKAAIKYGPIGATRTGMDANSTIAYSKEAHNSYMNGYFSLVGPDMYSDVNATPKNATGMNDMTKKTADGRFVFRSIDINGTNGKTHYTGGPFYGPYGITGTNNSNDDDQSDRLASSLGKEVFKAKDNHYSKHAKALCLSCHQRSAGAKDPSLDGTPLAGNQMELCSTWSATTDDTDNNWQDTASSPKCTKCHMPRLANKTVLHKWNKPNELFPRSELLTGYFDPADGDSYGEGHNPVVGKWMNDHGFIGSNRITGANYINKIKSGFDADVNATLSDTNLTITTTLLNKTAHMLPGAHPMRRMMTRIIVTDSNGTKVSYVSAVGNSTFHNIINTVVPSNASDTINTTGTGKGSVAVEYNNGRTLTISGLQTDLNATTVSSQKFNDTNVTITGADLTVSGRYVEGNVTKGWAKAVNITNSATTTDFTRIYGRETGKTYSGSFVVRPGFDSNTGYFDNRLTPNEKESYSIKYTVPAGGKYSVTFKVYYMLSGANGAMGSVGSDGFPADGTATTEVFSKTVSVQ